MATLGVEGWTASRDAAIVAARPARAFSLLDISGLLLLACMVFFNEANFRETDSENFSVDWQIVLRLCLLGMAGLFGLWHLPLLIRLGSSFPTAWFSLLAMWSLLVIPLSVNLIHSTGATAMLWCSILFIPSVLSRLGSRWTLSVMLATLIALLLASWFVYVVFPEFGRDLYQVSDEAEGEYRLGGLAHPNGTGVQAAWVVILALALWSRRWLSGKLLIAVAVLGGFTLVATDCRTAMISLAAAGLLFAWRHVRSVPVLYLGGSAAVLVAIGLLLGAEREGLFSSLSRTGEAHEVYELNGRTELWPRVIEKIAESPIVGFGHGCQRFVLPSLGLHWANYHAHNMLLHAMLGLGVIGGMLLLMSLLDMLFRLVASPATFPDMVTVFLLCGGIADSMIFSPVPDASSFMWIMALSWRYVANQEAMASETHREE